MKVGEILAELSKLAEQMSSATAVERTNLYIACSHLVKALDDTKAPENEQNYVDEKLGELRWHLKSAAGLDEGNNHEREQHIVWALQALDGIELAFKEASDNH